MAKSKRYDIYCVTKANRNIYLHRVVVRERSVGYAKKMAHDIILQKFGRHAFHLGTDLPKAYDWEVICQRRGVTTDAIRSLALKEGGWAIYAT